MRPGRLVIIATVLALGVGLVAGCSSGSSKKSSKTTTTAGGGGVTVSSAAQGTPVAIVVGDTKGTDGPMTLTATPASVPAGPVTFTVKNTGTIDHEVIVLKTDTPFDQLPVADAGDPPAPVKAGTVADKVDEGTSVGETGGDNLKPGETRSFTVKDMAAGKYVLVCNIAKHYKMGMRAAFTVT